MCKARACAPVTYNDLNEIIFTTPLVGGSTLNIKGVPAQMVLLPVVTNGDAVRLGSLAPNLGGTLANILGPVAVDTYSPDNVVTLVLDDSGNADLTPKHVTLTPEPPTIRLRPCRRVCAEHGLLEEFRRERLQFLSVAAPLTNRSR